MDEDEETTTAPPSLMVAYRLVGRRVLVVGGGQVAVSRTRTALEAGATVTLVCPKAGLAAPLLELIAAGDVRWEDATLTGDAERDGVHLRQADMVFSTIDDREVSASIAHGCRTARIPVNCADIPELCDFWFMSVHRDGPLQIGVSTNGNGPRLAHRLKQHIASTLPRGSGAAVENVGRLRKHIHKIEQQPMEQRQRMKWLSRLCDSVPLEQLATLGEQDIERLVEQYKARAQPQVVVTETGSVGKITLLGAGPGKPEFLTVAGRSALEDAQVVIADTLIPQTILDIAKGAEIVVAHKHEEGADPEQQRLNAAGIEALQQGKRVVRLKNGDPFLFGRGGEEILWYRRYGYEVELIPGVSSCFAAPAMAEIPVTHRGVADQLLILTAYGRGGASPTIPPYQPTRTLVFLMTALRAPYIMTQLLLLGYPPDLPAALVEKATLPEQRVFYCKLSELGDVAVKHKVTHPVTLVVGSVVAVLHQDIFNTPLTSSSEEESPVRRDAPLVSGGEKEEEDLSTQGVPSLPPVQPTPSAAWIAVPPAVPAVTAAEQVLQMYPSSGVVPPARKAIEFTDEHLAFVNRQLAGRTPQHILLWCAATLPGLVQVTSFGATGMVIIDMMHKLHITMPAIFLDTLHHFPETLEHSYLAEKKYGLDLHRYHCKTASSREHFEAVYGTSEMWRSEDKKYDYLVKVEPLERALRELQVRAWITGRRRDQGGMRANAEVLEFDIDGRLKVNVLAAWSWDDVWKYIRQNNVPYNPLYDQNYKSIGDYHSTKPVADRGAERSGRFVHQEDKMECGIHNRWRHVVK